MQVRLATFNLNNLGFRPGEESPEARARLPLHLEALRQVVRRLDADALAFQEVLDPGLLDPLLEGLGYAHRVVGERGSSPLVCGVASRQPLSAAEPVATTAELSLVDAKTGLQFHLRGPFSRPALRVNWSVPGMETTLVVIHWKSKIPSFTPRRAEAPAQPWSSLGDAAEGRLVTEVRRLAQAMEVRRVVDRLLAERPGARVAVLGDFNDTLESEAVRMVCGDARACDSPGLAIGELLPCELAVPPGLRYTQLYRGRPEMLDHILISRALVPHFGGARVLNEGLRPAETEPGGDPYDFGSDHAPLVATFRP